MLLKRLLVVSGLLAASLLAPSLLGPSLLGSSAAAEEAPAPSPQGVREIEIVVDGGYTPSRVVVTEGARVRLKVIRRDRSPCTREIVFASLGIRRELPTGVPVVIELPTLSPGEIEFTCGMNMLRGAIVVAPRK
ncbi:cupredoxin domain-containing protein [Sorangium sp. So ce513]|uniref:cupredoxin domain-containing protein n=1 Tax=Sorangium sp. So ce513 TaxID=3133315 RepID=UPI003F6104A9